MLWYLIILAGLIGVGWVGFKIKPAPFPNYPEETPDFETIPLPDNLPSPVRAFYQKIVGDQIPVIHSAVITGRGELRFGPVTFPGRLRFTHHAGYDYRHYIELTLFGRTVTRVNEHYRDGKGYMELPFGTFEDTHELNASANQAIWGEAMWFPTLWVTDPRVRWEAIDDTRARLIVPYEYRTDDPWQEFTVMFDPETHLIKQMETMRYQSEGKPRVCWILNGYDWKRYHGILLPSIGMVTWADQGYPWLKLDAEDVVYNVDVSEYLLQRGL